MSDFFFFLANCQTSSSHFLWVPFTLGGRHQLRPLSSLSVWLSFVHFLPRLPTPDPVGGASAGSRQVEIRGRGGVKAANALSMAGVSHVTRGLSVSTCFSFSICWCFINFLINANIWQSLQSENVKEIDFINVWLLYAKVNRSHVYTQTPAVHRCTQSVKMGRQENHVTIRA